MYQKITAITLVEGKQNARNYHGDKETVAHCSVIAVVDGKPKEVICYRAYMGRSRTANKVIASLWVLTPNCHNSGTGTAGGYGYHKQSAALYYAALSAGFTFNRPFDGTGEMDGALRAMAAAVGYPEVELFGFGY